MRRNRQASTNSAYGQFYAAGASGASGAPDAAFGGTPGRKLQRDRASAPTVAVKVDTAPRVGAFTGVVGRGSSQRALAVDSSLCSTLPARAGAGPGPRVAHLQGVRAPSFARNGSDSGATANAAATLVAPITSRSDATSVAAPPARPEWDASFTRNAPKDVPIGAVGGGVGGGGDRFPGARFGTPASRSDDPANRRRRLVDAYSSPSPDGDRRSGPGRSSPEVLPRVHLDRGLDRGPSSVSSPSRQNSRERTDRLLESANARIDAATRHMRGRAGMWSGTGIGTGTGTGKMGTGTGTGSGTTRAGMSPGRSAGSSDWKLSGTGRFGGGFSRDASPPSSPGSSPGGFTPSPRSPFSRATLPNVAGSNRGVGDFSASSSASSGASLSGGKLFPEAGACSIAGGMNGASKENQDEHFAVLGGRRHDFAVGVLDGHGADGRRVSTLVRQKIRGEIAARFGASFDAAATLAAKLRLDDANANVVGSIRGRDEDDASAATRAREVAGRATARALADAYAVAQRALTRAGAAVDHRESGCTAVVVAREGDTLVVANVGDSRAVLARRTRVPESPKVPGSKPPPAKFIAVDLSVDHKPDRPDEMARVERCGGVVEPARCVRGFVGPPRVWRRSPRVGGLAVSRAFGDTNLAGAGVTAEPEVTARTVDDVLDAFVVLASDGVWDHLTSDEAVQIAAAFGNDWQRAAEAVAAKAAEGWSRAPNGGYRDDITVVVAPMRPKR